MPSPTDATTLQAIHATVEAARAEAEIVWGAERLPLLVPETMRAAYGRQRLKLYAALEEAWNADVLTRDQLAAVEEHAGGMVRAYAKLVETAVEAGHRPLSVDAWETTLRDGTVVAVCRTNDEAAKVVHEGRYMVVYTLTEVANLIEVLPDALAMAKTVWPGAKVLPPSEAGPWSKHGDAIPFGDDVERAS